ncbi:MAG TPA: arsenic resistance N-acetyltransferase ArsN2 [Gemmatimonadales bacterium]|nr:arsenic resistance N-acetyltransferase ArsN2 [Gemmatimonadales bacterium]
MLEIRPAESTDLPAIERLLEASRLPLAGVREALPHFLIARQDGRMVGVIGMEVLGGLGLVRSAAVEPGSRGTGVGRALVERVLAEAASYRIRELYLLTTTAERWFTRFGFRHVERADVPEPIRSTVEFREACPESAAVMMREIERRREGR